MILFCTRYGTKLTAAVLLSEPEPHLVVENGRVYKPDDIWLRQYLILEGSEAERAALTEAGFKLRTPQEFLDEVTQPSPPPVFHASVPVDDDCTTSTTRSHRRQLEVCIVHRRPGRRSFY